MRLRTPWGTTSVSCTSSATSRRKSRSDAEALLNNVRAEFRQRLEQNTWLTPSTKAYALEKFDKIKIVVGYPDKWIDYSSVDVQRDDYFGDVMRLNEFAVRRALARLGTPPAPDAFSDPEEFACQPS